MGNAYLRGMFARLVTMLAIVAIAVMTTVTSAHAARMSAMPDHAAHVGVMMHAPDRGNLSCDGERHCESADAGTCEFACAGLSVFLPSPDGDAGRDFSPDGHDLSSGLILASRTPGLNERPPKLCLH